MDLTQAFPRSPLQALDGYTWLPRLIDKARASLAGTLGEYHYGNAAPMDSYFFNATGISAEEFLARVAETASDEAIVAWVQSRAPMSQAEKDAYRDRWLAHRPLTAAQTAGFAKRLASVAPGRKDIVTWAGLIAVEEGFD